MKIVVCVLFLASVASAIAVSQPVYANQQYISAQQLQPIQLRQQPQIQYAQPQYLSAGPTQAYQAGPVQAYQAGPPRAARPPPPPPQHPPVGITQLLLPSAADRQIQKAAATLAGPEYAQQVQAIQLQGLANQAQAAASRRAQLAAQRIAQANRQAPQPQYLQQLSQPQASSPEQQLDGLGQGAQQPEDYDHNPSYQFGFDVKDDFYTNYQNRKEQRDGDKISGSYSVVDSDGFIRTVTYTADPKEGFKAEVNRQPTDIVVKIPKPVLPPLRQPQQQQEQQYIQEAPLDRSQLQGQRQKYVYQYQ